jgi:tetraacyldisaccharide 4'-kinase
MSGLKGLADGLARRLADRLQRHWWRAQPSALSWLLQPLSWVYGVLATLHRSFTPAQPTPVPVLVVGNCIVGGAGKTPAVLAVVALLQAAGHRPAVLSRGYGRQSADARLVQTGDTAKTVGDEPLLMHQRSGAPVWVGQDRAALARQACRHDPSIDVLVCDDGLQHHRLARRVNLVVFDERGQGNGLLLPAGPLRQRLNTLKVGPQPPQARRGTEPQGVATRVLYNADHATTPLPGALVTRGLSQVWPLQAWQWSRSEPARANPDGAAPNGVKALHTLRGLSLLAVAGLGNPEKFFSLLEAAGLQIQRLPLPDHHPYDRLPWPAATADVITTEKDAIKLQAHAMGSTRVWVVPLDLQLPESLRLELLHLLFAPPPP